jgi:multicomponent Na+:H+ antiporter subunit B
MRRALLLVGSAGLGALLVWGMLGLPPFGAYPGPYGDVLNQVAVGERKATDVVSAVNFDYRGFDTMGEEFIFFTSVAGVAMLLRRTKEERRQGGEDEEEDRGEERAPPRTSDATRIFGVGLVWLTVIFGLYMVTHGQVTPGGGFQGGVVLATAPLVVYLAAEARTFMRIAPKEKVELAECVGAAGYVLIGLAGLVAGVEFLRNIVPLGKPEQITSAGTIELLNLTVGLEISGGFVVLLSVFLEEALERRLERESK